MAIHTNLPIYKVCYDLVVLSMSVARQMPRDVKLTLGRDLYGECMATMPAADTFAAGNSYLGLVGQATHSHHDQTRIASVLRSRGHVVAGDINKIYRRGP